MACAFAPDVLAWAVARTVPPAASAAATPKTAAAAATRLPERLAILMIGPLFLGDVLCQVGWAVGTRGTTGGNRESWGIRRGGRSLTTESAARPGTNWAGNIAFGAPDFARPATLGELQSVVARAARVRVLATGHSFNDLADSPGTQVSLSALPAGLETDSAASVVRVPAGLTYAQLAAGLDARGLALRNLASLPHISVAGACATATHGSGPANQNLAAAVTALTLVTADGDLLGLARGDDGFDGAVVHLGALGVVVSLTLDVVPSFTVAQRVYENLP